MPSWNIHSAHVEQLLTRHLPCELGITDTNCFLFGNFVPDIYVGYVVSPITKHLRYSVTHFADPRHVPEPDYKRFWDQYGCSHPDKTEAASDVVLGAWAHLLADNIYNHRVNEYLHLHGIASGERTRIRKQNDFDLFGHTLHLSTLPFVSDELLRQCAAFPQYTIEKADVMTTVSVAADLIRQTNADHIGINPQYDLLNSEFFDKVFAEVSEQLEQFLVRYGKKLRFGRTYT